MLSHICVVLKWYKELMRNSRLLMPIVLREMVNCFESLRFLLLLSWQFANHILTTGKLKILQF